MSGGPWIYRSEVHLSLKRKRSPWFAGCQLQLRRKPGGDFVLFAAVDGVAEVLALDVFGD